MKVNISEDYKKVSFSPNALYLYMNRLLISTGWGIVGAFGVIFFFEQFGNSITKVLLLYGALYAIYAITTPLGAKLIDKVGMKKMMMLAVIFFVTSILARLFWEGNPELFLILFFLSITLYKMLYWVPFHVEFAEFTDKKNRGKQVAILRNISGILRAITPLIGGFVLATKGYDILFLFALIIIFLSIGPLSYIKETHERYTWNLKRLLKELIQKENRPVVISQVGNGIQAGVGVIVWPIFIFAVLEENYLAVGIVTSLTIVALIALRLITGGLVDRVGKRKVLRFGTIFYTTGWIIKIFVETGTGIFLADTYHQLGKVVNKTSFDTEVYEQAADNGHYIDEYTVLKEISLNLGKGIMLFLSIILVSFFGITSTFILAAIATLLMTLATQKVQID